MRKMPNDVEKLDQISQSINLDGQGNLTVGKDLGVDGKLKLKSLVSDKNPDGDITKELGGKKLYKHTINASSVDGNVYFTLYNYSAAAIDSANKIKTVITAIGNVSATGYLLIAEKLFNVSNVFLDSINNPSAFGYCLNAENKVDTAQFGFMNFNSIKDDVKLVS